MIAWPADWIFALQDHSRSSSLWCEVMVSWLINSNGEHIQTSLSLCETLRFSLWCCWRYRYSGTWSCITVRVVPNIFKNSTTFVFRVEVVKEDWLDNALGTTILWNVWNYSQNDTVSHHRRHVLLSVTIMEIRPMILVFAQYTIICLKLPHHWK